jgi:hypothetical protein
MRTTAHQTRENRTITVDFQHEATYVQLLGDGKAFVEGSVTDSCAMTSVAEKSALIMASATPFCFCTTQKHIAVKIVSNSMAYAMIPPIPL